MRPHEVVLRPMITEKGTILQETGKYVFQVTPKATKGDIKQAIEGTFGVKVMDVNVARIRGKSKRFGPKFKKMPDIKKAIVTLKPGDRIQIVEGV